MVRRKKERQTGILMTGAKKEGWQPFATADEARARFAELVEAWHHLSTDYATVAELVIEGKVVEQVELQGRRARPS